MQIQYSEVYPFPSTYEWSGFKREGIYIFLNNRRQSTGGSFYSPLYVGQAREIGPELMSHFNNSPNRRLRNVLSSSHGDLFVVYAGVTGEEIRRQVEAYLINYYLSMGFELCNQQVPVPRPGFVVNAF